MYEDIALDPDAADAALVAAFDAYEPVAREPAIRALGKGDAIVWWDTVPLEAEVSPALAPETMTKIDTVPGGAWDRHRANVEKPRRIPLAIAAAPAVIAIARDAAGRHHLVVGYAAA